MGQIKGNPVADRSVQNQAYTNLYGVGNAAYRDGGTKPVMIDDKTTLNEVVDLTFDTDVMAQMVSQSIETTLATKATTAALTSVSSSIETTLATKATTANLTSVSSSLAGRLTITGSCANDAAAQAAGVPIGGLYHTTGTVKVRLT
jgi:hypothetical protein